MVNETVVQHNVQEFTLANLRKVKLEGQKIDALALIAVATTASSPRAKRKVLADCLMKCPQMNDHLSSCHFNRKALCPALTAEGAYYLMFLLATQKGVAGTQNSTQIERACLAIGTRMLACKQAAAELFQQVCICLERQPETKTEEIERDDYHETILRLEARETALIKKLHLSTETILLAIQLQKEVSGTVSHSLQASAKDTIQRIEDTIATQGTHDAIDLLRLFAHSPSEATDMASSFGKFLKAAREAANYAPNKHQVQFGSSPTSCHDVALYNPKLHAGIIIAAYESFKQSPTYAKCLDISAEKQRNLRRRHMQIMDIAETHSKPHGCLVLES